MTRPDPRREGGDADRFRPHDLSGRRRTGAGDLARNPRKPSAAGGTATSAPAAGTATSAEPVRGRRGSRKGSRPGRPRRLRRILAGLAALLLLLAIACGVAYAVPILTVAHINVTGATQADAAALTKASGVDIGDNMLRVNSAEAARNVAANPWVERVTVTQHWPRTIDIDVAEHVPVGYLKRGTETLLVDGRGKAFLSAPPPPGVPELRPASAQDAASVAAAARAAEVLPPDVRAQLDAVEAANPDSVSLVIREGKRVYWGSVDRAEEKAEATRIVLTQPGAQWNVSNPALPSRR